MATRMQQRRGTAAQWISTNSGNGPILAAGEVGFESDTNKFKIGDGVNHWVDLTYFTDADSIVAAVSGIVDGAPGLLDTLNELAAALGDDPDFLTNYATIQYVTDALGNAEVDQSTLAGAGIDWNAGTSQFDIDSTVATLTGTQTFTNKTLTSPKINEDVALTATATELNILDGATLSTTELNYVDGVTSAIQTQLNAKAPAANPTFTTGSAGTTVAPAYSGPQGAFAAGTAVIYGLSGNYAGYNTYDQNHIPSGWENHIPNDMSYYVGKVMVISGGEYPAYAGEWPIMEAAIGPQNQGYPIVFGLGNSFPGANTSNNGATVYIKTASTLKTVSDTELGYLDGVTSAIQTQLNAKAPLADPTFTGTATTNHLIVDGDFTVNGTNFAASATSIVIEDNMLQLAHQNAANSVDLGVVVGYTETGTAKHAGIVRDVSADTWKLFKGVTTEPSTTVDFTEGSLDDLAVAGLTASSITVGDVSNTEFGYLNGVTSAIQTQIDAKAPLSGPTFTGTVDFTGATVTGISSYSAPTLGSTQILSGATVTSLAGLTLSNPILAISQTTNLMVAFDSAAAYTSTNGTTWTARSIPSLGYSVYASAIGDSAVVAFPSRNNYTSGLRSTDGVTWTQITTPSIAYMNFVSWVNDQFIATAGYTTSYIASTDGITWTSRTFPTSIYASIPLYGNNTYVMIGDNQASPVYTSTDGTSWTQRTAPGSWYNDAIFGNGLFVAGANTDGARSTDGITWTAFTFPTDMSYLAYGNGKYVTMRYDFASYSTDAITWTVATLPSQRSWGKPAFANGVFTSFANGDAFSITSTDGITWTQNTVSTPFDSPSYVKGLVGGSLDVLASGTLSVAGSTGEAGQVLSSTGTGVQWITPAAGAAFSELMLIGA